MLEPMDYRLILKTIGSVIGEGNFGIKRRTDIIGIVLQYLSWHKPKYTRDHIKEVLEMSVSSVVEASGIKFGEYKPKRKK